MTTPCEPCDWRPATAEQRPLVVALHGDGQRARALFDALAPAARARDVSLLTPTCPTRDGCGGSYWRWNRELEWLRAVTTRAVQESRADTQRVVVVGWSGGASYLGAHAAEIRAPFTRAVFLGGGMPSSEPGCASSLWPALYVSGERNPLRHLALALRSELTRCGHALTWVDLPRADHAAEWRYVTSDPGRAQIFDFVEALPSAELHDAGIAIRDDGAAPPPASAAPLTSVPPIASRESRSGCHVHEQLAERRPFELNDALGLVLVLLVRRMRLVQRLSNVSQPRRPRAARG